MCRLDLPGLSKKVRAKKKKQKRETGGWESKRVKERNEKDEQMQIKLRI